MVQDTASSPSIISQSQRRRNVILAAIAAVAVVGGIAAYLARFRDRAEILADRIELKPGAMAGWNVLLVSMDTVRRDRLGCYGYKQIDTPVVDSLARQGIRFDQAVTSVPMTLPGHAAMLTGLDPQHHGARVNGMFRLNDRVTTLPEVLRKHGYRTGATVSAFVLDRRFGLDRGFDHYDDDLSAGRSVFEFSYRERPADQVNAAAIAWLRANAAAPFFMFVHYFDAHWPYAAPEPFAGRYKNNFYGDYDGEIAFVDDQLGKLLAVLDELKVRHRTLIVVVSDHGEGLDEHNEKTHSLLLYDSTLRVPMIFSGPAVLPRHRLVTRQVGLIDLAPTILDLLGIQAPAGMDGISLLSAPPAGPRALYIETLGSKFMHGWAPLVGVRRDDHKLVLAPRSELYDLKADPKELKNLYQSDYATASALYGAMKQMVGGDPELVTEVAANLPVDAEAREKLRALGYAITTTGPSTTQTTRPQTLPDPKDMIVAQRWVQQAQTLVHNGQNREALLLLEPYLREHPDDALALNVAGECYRNLGMLDQSMKAYRRTSELPYERALGFAGMASVFVMEGRFDEGEAACRKALQIDPSCLGALLAVGLIRIYQNRDAEAMGLLQQVIKEGRGSYDAAAYLAICKLHHHRGRLTEARQALERSLAADPSYPEAIAMLALLADKDPDKKGLTARLRDAAARRPEPETLFQLGRLEAQTGQWQQAEASLRESLAKRSDNARAHLELARVLQRTGKPKDAMIHLREALRLGPRDPEAAGELGMALAKQGRFGEARAAMERAVALDPSSVTYHYQLGLILAQLNLVRQAVEQFQQTVKLKPDHAHAHYNLGVGLQMLGQNDKAAECLRRAIELDPNLSRASQEAGSRPGARG
jgi:arylsulfatase A-like enzyme/Tfp pilus assembly protein PilF